MEEKWFAGRKSDAERWADFFEKFDGERGVIVECLVPGDILDKAHYDPRCDGYGPAWALEPGAQRHVRLRARVKWTAWLMWTTLWRS